jgi:hypothetical protein
MGKVWKLTLKNPDGTPFALLLADVEEFTDGAPPPKEAPGAGGNNAGGNTEEKMTDPQKRYLFRLLGAQGIEGKAAEDHLKDYFRVASLKDVPKLAASGYIDQLAKGRKEA